MIELHFEKNPFLVEKIEQQPIHRQQSQCTEKGLHWLTAHLIKAVEQPVDGGLKFNKLRNNINGDGIETDDDKEKAPALAAPHFDNEEKQRQRQKAHPGNEKNKRTGPQMFVDDKMEAPQQAERNGNHAGRCQQKHLANFCILCRF